MATTKPDDLVNVTVTAKILIGWMIILTLALIFNLYQEDDNAKFFTVGPNENFIFMGIKIDTVYEYIILVICISINTCIRNLNQDILCPWLIQVIQNDKKLEYSLFTAYEITIINGIYTWFDYVFNLNLAIIQIDMILIQVFINMLANITITNLYLKEKKTVSKLYHEPNYKSYESIV
jgi:hypothetical protein